MDKPTTLQTRAGRFDPWPLQSLLLSDETLNSNTHRALVCVLSCHKYLIKFDYIKPNVKISVFRVTGLKILGRVGGTHFSNYFLSGKKYNFMHFERHFAFQNAQNYTIFQKN